MFSSRLPAQIAPNAFTRELDLLRALGTPLVDLTETNPTRAGFRYPDGIEAGFSNPRIRDYAPEPLGMMAAREAVSGEFARQGRPIPASQVVLTASTSEAYALLFKLLCDPGDEVLVPQPSYPLFDLLTRLDLVSVVPYPLDYHGVWSIDLAALESRLTARTKAILIVSPNNPTGSMLRRGDLARVSALCASRGIAIVGDEVFADYPIAPREDACAVTVQSVALTFSLGGLSKSVAMPQMKLGWMSVTGPDALVRDSLARLELICDTYLSVSTPVQVAAPALLAAGAEMRAAIIARIRQNLDALRACVRDNPSITLLEPEGGWCAVLKVPATEPEEALVLRLLRDARVIVHPGYFFDFPAESHLIVSLLPETEAFAGAMRTIASHLTGLAA